MLLLFTFVFLIASCQQEVDLTELQAGKLSIVEGSSYDFGYTPLDAEKTKTLNLINDGNFDITSIRAPSFSAGSPFGYAGSSETAAYPGLGGTCASTLAIGQQCQVILTFKPTASKLWSENISFLFLNGVQESNKSFSLRGISGIKPLLEFGADEDNTFGILETGDSVSKVYTITNKGKLPVLSMSFSMSNIGDIDYAGGSYPGSGGNCGSTLAAGATCSFVLEFVPLTDRSHSSTLTVSYDNFISVQTASKSFTGISLDIVGKMFFLGIVSQDFGIVVEGSEQVETVIVKNEGYAAVSSLGFSFSSSDVTVKDNRCPTIIEPAIQCEVDLAYSPTVFGSHSSTVKMTYNDSKNNVDSPSIDITASGRRKANLVLENSLNTGVAITSFDFGIVGQNAKKVISLNVANDGGIFARLNNFTGLAAPFTLTGNTCGAALAVSSICQLVVQYEPTALGTHNDQLEIHYNDGSSDQILNFSLQGEAQARAVLSFDGLDDIEPSYHYGEKAIGSSTDYLLTLKNIGIVNATNIILPVISAPLAWNGLGSCAAAPFSLNSGASCTLGLTFTPTSVLNSANQDMSLTYFDSVAAESRSLSITYSSNSVAQVIYSNDGTTDLLSYSFGKASLNNDVIIPLILYNTGGFSASSITYTFSHTDFSFSGISPTTGPKGETGDCPDNGGSLSSSCTVYIKYRPSGLGVLNETLTIQYDNGLTTTSYILNLQGEGDNLAHLEYSPNDSSSSVAMDSAVFPGGSSNLLITVTNSGQALATSLAFSNIVNSFSVGGATTCSTTLASGANCVLEIDLTPTSLGALGLLAQINYFNGDSNKTDSVVIETSGVTASNVAVAFPVVTPYAFEEAEINNQTTFAVTLRNDGGGAATYNSVTSSNGLFSIINNQCTSGIISFSTCVLTIGLTPTDAFIGQTIVSNITFNYFDGVVNKDLIFQVEGLVVPPKSFHGGWSMIKGIGNSVSVANSSYNDKKVVLSWKDMIPTQAYPIDSYNVYRKSPTDEVFDYTVPLATGISAVTKSYSDTSVTPGEHYVYQVLPIISGGASKVDELYATVEVYVPSQNRVFIHRRIANELICASMSKPRDRLDGNSCAYTGHGNNGNNRFDFTSHLIVDRYELGINGKPQPGQLAKETFTQTSLDLQCKTNSLFINETFQSMRVPSRLEYNMYSLWSAGTSVEDVENGFIYEEKCNTNAVTAEDVGNNTSCRSTFDIYNTVGNAWEWVSDRLENGIGVTNDANKLYPENDDMDLVNISSITSMIMDTTPCTSTVLGHPLPLDGGLCPEGSQVSSTLGIVEDYFWNPSSFGASFAVGLVGGSYDASTFAGRYTTAWVPTSFSGGGRCVLSMEEGEIFPVP